MEQDIDTVNTIPAQPPITVLPTTVPENVVTTDSSSAKEDREPEYLGLRALALLMSSLLLVVIILTLDQSVCDSPLRTTRPFDHESYAFVPAHTRIDF